MPAYKGPTSDFPYAAYKILGGAHIVFGICMLVVGIVHATLSYEDRKYFLLSGSVSVWCPLFAVAVGVTGVLSCKQRYWEVECMRTAFIVVSFLTMIMMAVLIIVTVLIDFYYYDIIDLKPSEIFDMMKKRFSGETQEKDGYLALLSLIVVFASCEFIIAFVSACVGLCCSPTYEPDKGQGFQLINRPKPIQQVQVVEKPKPAQLMIQAPQQTIQRPAMLPAGPTHILEPVQIIQNHQPAPSLMYVPSTLGPY